MSKRASTPPTQRNATRARTTFSETVQRPDFDGQDELLDKALTDSKSFPAKTGLEYDRILVKFLGVVLTQTGVLDGDARAKDIYVDNEEAWEEISPLLRESIENKSFYTVRRLAILQPPRVERKSYKSPVPEVIRQAVEKAWTVDYVGSAHELLFNNIKTLFTTNTDAYGREVSIIQSSGSGKSRTVHELSKLVFTIPLNLRTEVENNGYAYPMPDSVVNTLFERLEEDRLRMAVSLFFQYLFQHITVLLDSANDAPYSRPQLAVWWSNYLEEGRQIMYQEVFRKTSDAILHPKDTIQGCTKAAADALTRLCSKIDAIAPSDETAKEPAIIFYVDEAHTLMESKPSNAAGSSGPDNYPKSRLDVFRSCAANFQLKQSIFFIYLSTVSKLAHFAPKKDLMPSARARTSPHPLPAPITETPFDCYFQVSQRIITSGSLKHDDVADIFFLSRFGRPLFWTMIRDDDTMIDATVDLAAIKLIGSENTKLEAVGDTGRLAVLDVLLSIGYERKEAAYTLEANMVASHMRTAFSVPEHRQYVSSGYPSEPFLAEVASRALWDWRRQAPDVVLTTLTKNLKDNILDLGELGELVGRELLVHAYQKSVKYVHGYLHFSNGCLLTDFIGNLFTTEYAELVLSSVPDNVQPSDGPGIKFREAFKGARVRFTHFAKVTDQSGVTTNAMWAAYVRGMAIICPNNHRAVDCIIPVLIWNAFLCEHVMTGLLIQFKRRAAAGPRSKYDVTQEDIGFFGSFEEEVCKHAKNVKLRSEVKSGLRPYVALIMELGIQPRPAAGSRATKPSSSKATSLVLPISPSKVVVTEPALRKSSRTAPAKCHPRYQIFSYGCSPTVYSVIGPGQKDQYALLLRSRNLLDEHARQDAESLSAVKRLKPFFSQGPDSYHWLEDPVLNFPSPLIVDPDEEKVEVGIFKDADDDDDEM